VARGKTNKNKCFFLKQEEPVYLTDRLPGTEGRRHFRMIESISGPGKG